MKPDLATLNRKLLEQATATARFLCQSPKNSEDYERGRDLGAACNAVRVLHAECACERAHERWLPLPNPNA